MGRSDMLVSLLLLIVLLVSGAHAQQDYPANPVKIVIGFPPGGPTDIVGRPVAAKLAQVTGQQFIIDNRAGANGQTRAVNRAPACGM